MQTASHHPARRRQEGSAYLIALLGLLLLTIMGLNVSLVTQSEMQLGDLSRSAQRVFYASEAGFSPAVSRAVLDADYSSHAFSVPESASPFDFRNEVDVSAFFPILTAPCNLCQINNAGAYGTKQYFEVTHAVTTRAERLGGAPGISGPLASKTLSEMVDIQPAEVSADSHLALMDPQETAKIRF